MRLQKVMAGRRSVFHTADGSKFFGELLAPPQLDNPNRMEQPRMFLKLDPAITSVVAGTAVILHGKRYLVCENADSEQVEVIYRTFKLIRLDRELEWKRLQKITDPISGLTRSHNEATPMGTIWVGLETDRELNDTRQITTEQFTLYTNADLQLNDTVGIYTVTLLFNQLGVTVAKVK